MTLKSRGPRPIRLFIDEMKIFRPREIQSNVLIPFDASSFIIYINDREIEHADITPSNSVNEKKLKPDKKTTLQKIAVIANCTIKIKRNRRVNIIDIFTLCL
jgi:hypothetical protein